MGVYGWGGAFGCYDTLSMGRGDWVFGVKLGTQGKGFHLLEFRPWVTNLGLWLCVWLPGWPMATEHRA